MMSLPGRMTSLRMTKASHASIDVAEKHLPRHVAINGQVFAQSGTADCSCGQHGMSAAISGIDMLEVAVIAAPSTGAVNGPATSPTIARIGSSRRSQALTFMGPNDVTRAPFWEARKRIALSQPPSADPMAAEYFLNRACGRPNLGLSRRRYDGRLNPLIFQRFPPVA